MRNAKGPGGEAGPPRPSPGAAGQRGRAGGAAPPLGEPRNTAGAAGGCGQCPALTPLIPVLPTPLLPGRGYRPPNLGASLSPTLAAPPLNAQTHQLREPCKKNGQASQQQGPLPAVR